MATRDITLDVRGVTAIRDVTLAEPDEDATACLLELHRALNGPARAPAIQLDDRDWAWLRRLFNDDPKGA